MRSVTLPNLPIKETLPAVHDALAGHSRVILAAPPGAGKSTVVPLSLLDAPWLGDRKVLMLEPRRIAARAVATRMADLLGEPVGRTVGYRTRLENRVSAATRIEVVTEGILTRLLQDDAALTRLGCIIFDEFHERSLNADLGLALCIESQRNLREDLRLLVMSATLDLDPLARLLHGAPVIVSQGRVYAVKTYYVPARKDVALELHTAQVVRRALEEHSGDILCFLPGGAEIGRVMRSLHSSDIGSAVRIWPLFGDLEGSAQDAALAPASPGTRKVVLATSIAETSLTMVGVRIVIDAGLRRYSEFDPATGMSRLVTSKVSQAAADQRLGRAGRLSDGVCFRLWSEGTQDSLQPHTPPEITHADLAPLALELACWGATDPTKLLWLDQPPSAPLAHARDLLRRLEGIDADDRVTLHGRALAKVGAHPRIAHMLVKGRCMAAGRLASELAAILGERDVLRASGNLRDADLRLRVNALRGDLQALPAGMEVDHRALNQARRTSLLWQRNVAGGNADPHTDTGTLLALAYPDRIARTRDESGRYVLSNGRGARFAEPQALAKSEFIVVAQLDGAERDARIFLAAPVALAAIEREYAAHIVEREDIRWDDRSQSVRARKERLLGELVLHASDIQAPDWGAMQRAALCGLQQLGIAALPWSTELRQWQARVMLMAAYAVPADERWPDVSDDALADGLPDWAPPWIIKFTRREHFARIDMHNALRARLTYSQQATLDREAPTHFVVPSGSRVAIDYLDGEIPTLSVRLQEMFGLQTSPSIAAGRLSLLLKLLSPAGRPVQITRDLVSFWRRGYHDVKKDLKGRYPKHHWPDDPHAAAPTRRLRPRR